MKQIRIFLIFLGSGIGAQILMIIASLFFARFYSPDAFGMLAYFSGFASLFAIISGFRFDYLVFSKDNKEKIFYNWISLATMLLLHLMFFTLIYFIRKSGFKSEKNSYWLVFYSFSTSIFYLSTQLLISFNKYSTFSKVRILQAFLQLSIGIALFYMGVRSGLFLAYSLSQLVIGLLTYSFYLKSLRQVGIQDVKKYFGLDFKNASFNTLLILIQYSTPFAPIVIGNYFFNKSDVGAYFLFSSSIGAPLAIFRRSVINFLNGEVVSISKGKEIKDRLFSKATFILLLISVVLTFVIFIISTFSKSIVQIVFGIKWNNYSNYLLPLFIFYFFDALLQPFTTLLPLWGKSSFAIQYEVLRFTLVFLLLPIFAALFHMTYFQVVILYFVFTTTVYLLNIYRIHKFVT